MRHQLSDEELQKLHRRFLRKLLRKGMKLIDRIETPEDFLAMARAARYLEPPGADVRVLVTSGGYTTSVKVSAVPHGKENLLEVAPG